MSEIQEVNPEVTEEVKEEVTEVITPEEAERIERIFFEDDEEITLRDGKKYKIIPVCLNSARKLMKLLKTAEVQAIILNFSPSGDDDVDEQRENDLMSILEIAFENYGLKGDYLSKYTDVLTAAKIIDVMIGINGLKKALPPAPQE
jgi:uncharacterized protein (DUF2344 family)